MRSRTAFSPHENRFRRSFGLKRPDLQVISRPASTAAPPAARRTLRSGRRDGAADRTKGYHLRPPRRPPSRPRPDRSGEARPWPPSAPLPSSPRSPGPTADPLLRMALRITTALRMHATSATLPGLPRAVRRSYSALSVGFQRSPTRADVEQGAPHLGPPAGDLAHPAHLAAVARERRQPGQTGRLPLVERAQFGHVGHQISRHQRPGALEAGQQSARRLNSGVAGHGRLDQPPPALSTSASRSRERRRRRDQEGAAQVGSTAGACAP